MRAKKRAKGGEAHHTPGSPPKGAPLAPVVCPECNGPLWEFHNGKLVRYQCLVGHRYTLKALLAAHNEELETALWVALRVLEERINLQHRLVERSRASGQTHGRNLFEAKVKENEQHARVLRGVLEELAQ